mmetsp:Transcript_69048/g.213641  ORF Transcript_69048/g.213641 Transcript_69048/m.213641 type:complete len:213 (-) Transcript_69048:146-784(-)
MTHKNTYVPYAKADAFFRDHILRENRVSAKKPSYKGYTDEERKEAISNLNPVLRPRPVIGDPPPAVSSSMAATLQTGLGRSWAALSDAVDGPSKTPKRMHFTGLSNRPELNGAACEVVDSMPDSSGRVTVRLTESPDGSGGKLMRIRASRLSANDPGPHLRTSQSMGELGGAGSAALRPLPLPKCRRSYSRKPTGGFWNHSFGVEAWNSHLV